MTALTLDIEAYKQRFRKLKQETVYEKVNRVGSEHKRQAWATCKPLGKDQLWDDFESPEYDAVLINVNPHKSSRRSTMDGGLYAQIYALIRVTERLAILHSLGVFKFMSEDPVVQLNELPAVRYCITCKKKKAITNFVFRPKWLHEWGYQCTTCSTQQVDRVWRKRAA